MAGGFTIKNKNLDKFKNFILKKFEKLKPIIQK